MDATNPSYYQFEDIQPIDLIEQHTKYLYGVYAFDTGNIIKYASRWPYKNGLQDLEKCAWYAHHLRDKVERDYANGYRGILGMHRLRNEEIVDIGNQIAQITNRLTGKESMYTYKILMLAFTWRSTGHDTSDLNELVNTVESLIDEYTKKSEKGSK